ncbi:hypothetical protein PC120_g6218 [Phytophthora cactorum]|nr:hypothetical protein PC120_g6218 [Phytophthora cactorum]
MTQNPEALVKLMARDVASAFRSISVHSQSVHHFELPAPFVWTGPPGVYEVVGRAMAFIHGSHVNSTNPAGFVSYHWVDDHINMAGNKESTCAEM